jgi:hypothetical protein
MSTSVGDVRRVSGWMDLVRLLDTEAQGYLRAASHADVEPSGVAAEGIAATHAN